MCSHKHTQQASGARHLTGSQTTVPRRHPIQCDTWSPLLSTSGLTRPPERARSPAWCHGSATRMLPRGALMQLVWNRYIARIRWVVGSCLYGPSSVSSPCWSPLLSTSGLITTTTIAATTLATATIAPPPPSPLPGSPPSPSPPPPSPRRRPCHRRPRHRHRHDGHKRNCT